MARLGMGVRQVSEAVKVLIADKMDPRAAAIFRDRCGAAQRAAKSGGRKRKATSETDGGE